MHKENHVIDKYQFIELELGKERYIMAVKFSIVDNSQ